MYTVDGEDIPAEATIDELPGYLGSRPGPAVLPHQSEDSGLPGIRGGFHLCTAWLIDALARIGRVGEARDLFDAMLTCLGPTGLLPEGYDPVAERGAGNHPTAFCHAGLVHAAVVLDRYL